MQGRIVIECSMVKRNDVEWFRFSLEFGRKIGRVQPHMRMPSDQSFRAGDDNPFHRAAFPLFSSA
jgi:hypothetical protein